MALKFMNKVAGAVAKAHKDAKKPKKDLKEKAHEVAESPLKETSEQEGVKEAKKGKK